MSASAPKRLLNEEEKDQSKSGKRPHENIDAEISNSLGNEQHHLPIKHIIDDRIGKIQRIDTSEVEKISSLLPKQVPSPSITSYLDHSSITSCDRLKLDGFKDDHHNRDVKVETREKKVDNRELHNEMKLDPHVKREENSADFKEIRFENESAVDFKPDTKSAKDSSNAENPHSNAKEIKELYKTLKYSESSSDVSSQLRVTQHTLPIPVGKSMETPTFEVQEFLNAHKTVAENKIELNSEEKIRENQGKKNDDKHNNLDENEKNKQGRNTNMNLANSSKESLRDHKDAERWERKDLEDTERDQTDKTPSNLNGKESMDISPKIIEKENTTLDTKKSTGVDSGKICDTENKNLKRSWYQVAQMDKHKGKKETDEKESEDGYTERISLTERDREISSPSVHQHKRLLRQKGTPQPSLRESRFPSRTRESEG